MRIDDDVRAYSLDREGHVFLAVGYSAGAFLAVARCEFVALLGFSVLTHFYLDEFIAVAVLADHYFLDYAFFCSF